MKYMNEVHVSLLTRKESVIVLQTKRSFIPLLTTLLMSLHSNCKVQLNYDGKLYGVQEESRQLR